MNFAYSMLATVSALALAGTAQGQTPAPRSSSATQPPAGTATTPTDATPPASNQAGVQPAAVPAETPSPQDAATAPAPEANGDTADDVVVTGIRQSLERAAEIKRDAIQVVDSIVAQDIGKLPDPTTAAALQRVPGVQVSVNRNNELGDVRVRGLPDILTTVNGREVFTTTGRNFDLQDLPAEALSRVDVFKSQTADLIEGGLAGAIDLQLNKPFNFRKPTAVLSARTNYGVRVEKFGQQYGALLTNRWDTPIGEIGLLANGTYSRSDYYRAQTILRERRSSQTTPFNRAGLLLPNILQNFPESGFIERQQFNASAQWQISPAIQAYAEGFYTYFRDRGAHEGANVQAFTTNVSIASVTPSDRCITATIAANGQNYTGPKDTAPVPQTVCEPDSVTLNNPVVNFTTAARDTNQRNKQIAGGLKYDEDGWKANIDASFQRSALSSIDITADAGKRLTSLTAELNDDGDVHYTIPGDQLTNPGNIYIRNALIQSFTETRGYLFAVKADGAREFGGGILRNVKVGARYAKRTANQQSNNVNTTTPGGNIGTGSEATAVLVSRTGLPNDFLRLSAVAPDTNGGARFLTPNADFLLDEPTLNLARAYFRLPAGQPAFDPVRQFDATEKTLASYLQGNYELDIGSAVRVDGVVGARVTQTQRDIRFFEAVPGATLRYLPRSASTTDLDVLPNASARIRVDNNLQFRAGFQKSLRRPNFGDLNPTLNLNRSNNPLVQSGGSAGNPNLKPQKSDSYDATAEYYFHGGYVAVAGYYRNITDRVINAPAVEVYDGVEYAVSRPRNVGKARLQGVEVSGQYFADFLPGALSGIGVQGSFTFSDSEIQGGDPLAGNPLQGVSKYNYTTGLLYEKFGVSGRLVYTYRSKYFASNDTGTPTVRPGPVGPPSPTLLTYVRGGGRLDFNVGVDVSDALRVDIGGTNVLNNRTRSYYAYPGITGVNSAINYDESTYTLGVRLRL